MSELSPGAQRVQDILRAINPSFVVVELPSSTRSAQEAALSVGCEVKQIVKSLIFRTVHSGKPILILASGVNRVDEQMIASRIGEPIEKADAGFVREHTGFAIGGVSPVGLKSKLKTYIDKDLSRCDPLWAAAGTPNAVFRLTFADLVSVSGGEIVPIH